MQLPIVDRATFGECDLVIAFGGDGTLIRATHLVADYGTPILGVYFGRFGFVTQCMPSDLFECLERFMAGERNIDSRMMLEAELLRGGSPVASVSALNEAVLQRDVSTRMMTFRVVVDGHVLTSYPADGVIVATSTGSTAYNLSVGGPVMDPQVPALVLSAIAPHTLNARTLIVRPESEIILQIRSHGDAILSADGQTRLHLLSDDEVRVTRSKKCANLVRVGDNDFLDKLGRRLLWSQGMVGDEV